MPEMRFRIRWPDGRRETCYSPSLAIKDYFAPGRTYPIEDFLAKSREALTIASARVEARYGFPCALALGQLREIEAVASTQPQGAADTVLVEAFEE